MGQEKVNTAVILAAGAGTRLADFTRVPKCLLPIGGRSIISRQVEILSDIVRRVVVVVGYEADAVKEEAARCANVPLDFVENRTFTERGNAYSLYLGLQAAQNSVLVVDGDLVFAREVLKAVETPVLTTVIVGDASPDDTECAKVILNDKGDIQALIDKRALTETERAHFVGEAIGIIAITACDFQKWLSCASQFFKAQENALKNWEHLVNLYASCRVVRPCFTNTHRWIEIDTLSDYQEAMALFKTELSV